MMTFGNIRKLKYTISSFFGTDEGDIYVVHNFHFPHLFVASFLAPY